MWACMSNSTYVEIIGQLEELVLSFHSVGPRNPILDGRCLYLLSYLTGLHLIKNVALYVNYTRQNI